MRRWLCVVAALLPLALAGCGWPQPPTGSAPTSPSAVATTPGATASVTAATPGALTEFVPWGAKGAIVLDLAPDPAGGVYAATRFGVFHATRTGQPVRVLSAGLPSYCSNPTQANVCLTRSIAVDRAGVVYVSVGSSQEKSSGGFIDGSVGLYRLAPGSSAWQRVAKPADFVCPSDYGAHKCQMVPLVAVGPDAAVYLVAAGSHASAPEDRDGVYRSADGGRTWSPLERIQGALELDRLAVGPDGRIWVIGGWYYYKHVRYIASSTDGGKSWDLGRIDPRQRSSRDSGHRVTDFAFLGGTTYVTTVESGSSGTKGYPLGLYASTDGGRTWSSLTPDNPPITMVAVAARSDGTLCYAYYSSVATSSDAGRTWRVVPVHGGTVNTLAVDTDGYLWVGTEDDIADSVADLFVQK